MLSLSEFVYKIRRAETPFYAFLFRMAKGLMATHLPVPGFLLPLFRLAYHFHFLVRGLYMRGMSFFYWEPLFRGRCERAGKNLDVTLMPDISSNLQVFVGDNVRLNGKMGVSSGKGFKNPRLVLGDKVQMGHLVTMTINKEIVFEEGVMVASNCYFADSDAHPTDPIDRVSGKPPSEDRVLPIRICRNAWIGHSVHILKGVTVGEAAIVAACSVVVKDVPPYSVVAGNPAKVVASLPNPAETEMPPTRT
jgi:acetyltransferase-like isoleucine patch superfamily enzyme